MCGLIAYTFTLAAAAFTSYCESRAVRSSCREGSLGAGVQHAASMPWNCQKPKLLTVKWLEDGITGITGTIGAL